MQRTGSTQGNKRATGHWTRWYSRHNWKSRAEAYDVYLDREKRRAEAEEWKRRGEAIAEEQYELAQEMLKKVRQMLQFPLAEKTAKRTDEEGNEVKVTVEPARWNFNTVARVGKVAIELARLEAGLPTKNEQAVHFEIDPSKLTDDQNER